MDMNITIIAPLPLGTKASPSLFPDDHVSDIALLWGYLGWSLEVIGNIYFICLLACDRHGGKKRNSGFDKPSICVLKQLQLPARREKVIDILTSFMNWPTGRYHFYFTWKAITMFQCNRFAMKMKNSLDNMFVDDFFFINVVPSYIFLSWATLFCRSNFYHTEFLLFYLHVSLIIPFDKLQIKINMAFQENDMILFLITFAKDSIFLSIHQPVDSFGIIREVTAVDCKVFTATPKWQCADEYTGPHW